MWPWLAFALFVGLIYATLGIAPSVGRALLATTIGAWSFGHGLPTLLGGGGALLGWRLFRRAAPPRAYVMLGVAIVGYAGGLLWLRTQRLERIHLPEYGVVTWLGWRALVPMLGDRPLAYSVAALLATAVGWGEEILQGFVPGRFYDLRDVGANALGAVLGAVTLAALRTGGPPNVES